MKWHKTIILIGSLVVGCVPPPATPTQIGRENVPTLLSPLVLTATVVSSTVTPISTAPTSENSNSSNCFEVLDKAPEDKLGTGVVVLENRKYDSIGRGLPGFFLLNMQTRKINDLDKSNEGFGKAVVSPDGTMLSVEYVKFEREGDNVKTLKDELLIITADGTILQELQWEQGWVGDAVWLDDQRVIINVAGLDPEESRAVKPSTLLVLNPFTGERKILKPDLPGIYNGYPLPYWGEPWGHSLSVYNRPLSRVVYLGGGGYTYVLWDVEKKRELLRFVSWFSGNDERPSWSPDGSKFVVSAYFGNMDLWPQPADGLYLIDTEGNVSKLLSTNRDVYFYDHFWSPSGKYIALLVDKSDSVEIRKRLWLLDIQTSQVVDTCIEYRSLSGDDMPIWSPDETQILLYDSTQAGSKVILVDLVERITYQIAEDMEPKGWLKSP
ncbi:MAG: hypothetical protein ABI904_07465 [Chloroflexota bacterium]